MRECEIKEESHFKRSLKGLDKEVLRRVEEAKQLLKKQPFSGRPLKGRLRKLRRYRIGKYRLVYKPEECLIHLITIKHRETVYSRL